MKRMQDVNTTIIILLILWNLVTFNGFNVFFTKFISKLILVDFSKSILENLYYLSGIVLVSTIIIAYRNLEISKKSVEDEAKRNEAMATYDLCEKYTTNLLPHIEDYLEKYSGKKQDILNLCNIFDEKDKSCIEDSNLKKILIDNNLDEKYYNDGIVILNKLEIIAFPFISKLANIELAIPILKGTFIPAYEGMKPIIINERNADETAFELIINLFEKVAKSN